MKLTDELREMAKSSNPSDRAWCAIATAAADRIEELVHADSGDNRSSEKSGWQHSLRLKLLMTSGWWFMAIKALSGYAIDHVTAVAGILSTAILLTIMAIDQWSGDRTDDAKQKVSA